MPLKETTPRKKRSKGSVAASINRAEQTAKSKNGEAAASMPEPYVASAPPSTVSGTADLGKMRAELELLRKQNEIRYGLPFLHGWKFYEWARVFFESRNKMNFLCAANQISKSSTQIRKCIHWATATELWPQLWAREPSQFWYLYPAQDVVNIEFALKWEKEFLPRGRFKDDPVYGWKPIMDRKDVKGIIFNSGVHIYFKTYTKDVQNLQTGTVDAIFCDEELPEKLYNELTNRINATDGYFHMVFTATLGQEIWRKTMEPGKNDVEMFPDALKLTVSLYQAMNYEDGTPSFWTMDRIAAIKAKCSTHAEVLKRVYGRFILIEGRMYSSFNIAEHVAQHHHIPKDWIVYAGVDVGSGGEHNHPSAIAYVAVRPDYRAARVFLGWRGDGIVTTDSDVVQKYRELNAENHVTPTLAWYDYSAADFGTISVRMDQYFQKADKNQERGQGVLNTLFKNGMLLIFDTPELAKLAGELATARKETSKTHRKDDFIDALRYAVVSVPWDFSGLVGIPSELDVAPEKQLSPMEQELADRRKAFDEAEEDQETIDEEIAAANEMYEAY